MDDENVIVENDEEIVEEATEVETEESEEIDTEPEEISEDDIDDFEYDDDGNIIIPEAKEESAEEAEEETEEKTEEKAETKSDDLTEKEEEKDSKNSEEYEKLKEQYEYLLSLGEETLKKLGVNEADVIKGLAEIAAEASDETPEKFLKDHDEKLKNKAAQKKLALLEFEKRAANDLNSIHEEFPETKAYKDMRELPNIAKIAKYIDLGLSACEAYAASNPRAIREAGASSARQKALNDTKSHLKSKVNVSSSDSSVKISKSELDYYMDLFPDMSKREIAELYGKATKK